MKEIKEGQVWEYHGLGIGRNVRHIITECSIDWSVGILWITTWSEPINNLKIGGFSWRGPSNVFLREFTQKK